MPPIKVLIHGAAGKMGREIALGLSQDTELEIVGGVDIKPGVQGVPLASGKQAPYGTDLSAMLANTKPHVMVDFSSVEGSRVAVEKATKAGINFVIGTTGLTAQEITTFARLCDANRVGGVIAANFSMGAVLMIHLAKIAAPYFEYAEIIELHHEEKTDAPSGTSIATAQAISSSRNKPLKRNVPTKEIIRGARSAHESGVTIHSVRLPGLVAHQEVMFGGLGQTLSIRHDTINRECYVPGVALAIKYVAKRKGLTQGLDKIMGL